MVLVSNGFLSAILDSVLDPGIYMWIYWIHLVAVFPAAAGAFCFCKSGVPGFVTTCISFVEVFPVAAGAFLSGKMTFLGFSHVLGSVKSSRLPQALFCWCGNAVPGFVATCVSFVEVFSSRVVLLV